MSQKERQNGKGKTRPNGDNPHQKRKWPGILRHYRAILWAVSTFVVVFAVLFVSQVPQQIKLRAGEVSPINVKAPQEVIDKAATERLKAEKAASVNKIWETDPKVLADLKVLVADMKDKVVSLGNQPTMTTQEILSQLRPFVTADLPDADIIAMAAASPRTVEASVEKLNALLESVLSPGLKAENLQLGKEQITGALNSDKDIPAPVASYLSALVEKNLRPNHIFNEEETARRIKEAVDAVEPVRIKRGQFIVREGEVVTDDQIAILEELGMMGGRVRFTALLGSFVVTLLILGFLGVYLYTYHPDMTAPNSDKLPLVACTMVLAVVLVKVFSQFSGLLAPTAAGVMLASTLIERRLGVFYATCITLALGAVTGFEMRYVVLSLVSGIAASLTLKADWNRTAIVKAGLVVSAVNTVTHISLGLIGAIPMGDALAIRDLLFTAGNGVVSAVLALGSLPLLEMMFGIITPVRLLEISNPDHPLLHRLLLEAPGTYHHSIMVGNLAEAAAVAIGANSLLARVGAYYHDVGKIKRPYFFSENQVFGMENPHDKMSPTLSASVITSHVRDGLELAEEYKVPAVIRKFISEHHGTTLASYFYMKASEQAKDNRGPEEWDFRYEGPRPDSKETAIVMLADSVEAAVRSITKPTPARIESTVRRIIQEKLNDHQLDRSDLTLRELDVIADAFTKVLTGIFHTRIEYPDKNEKTEKNDKAAAKASDGNEGANSER